MKFKKNNYILFWISQAISQLGSGMTGFALILWSYSKTNSAMAVSLLMFFSYVPYIISSIFAGTFVDNHKKKIIMLWSDSIAATCTIIIGLLLIMGQLQIWHIYMINAIIGFTSAFQSPASSVAVGMIVPKEKYEKVSGMNSFSSSLIEVTKPMLATAILSFCGLYVILLIDLISFGVAFFTLLLFIPIPEDIKKKKKEEKDDLFSGTKEGFSFLLKYKGLFNLIISMAVINFFSRLTYENILSPMLISRNGGNLNIVGFITSVMGLAGIVGGLAVTFVKLPKNKIKVIYFSTGFSFLFGDLLMGLGQNIYVWSIAAIAACLPISFINAAQNVIFYNMVPKEMQGRVFATRNCLQFFSVPIGILLGGALADYVFEPFMQTNTSIVRGLQKIVGSGTGSGMAVMFLCTGIIGFGMSLLWYRNKNIRTLLSESLDY